MSIFKTIEKPEMKIIGITARTDNKSEMSGAGKIGALWQRFMQEGIQEKIPNKVNPDTILSVYTDYETDETGPYSVTIGCEVRSFDHLPPGMVKKIIPAQKFAVLTTPYGEIPGIILDGWKAIWSATPDQLGGERRRGGDFELYDARSRDLKHAQVDLYVGVQ